MDTCGRSAWHLLKAARPQPCQHRKYCAASLRGMCHPGVRRHLVSSATPKPAPSGRLAVHMPCTCGLATRVGQLMSSHLPTCVPQRIHRPGSATPSFRLPEIPSPAGQETHRDRSLIHIFLLGLTSAPGVKDSPTLASPEGCGGDSSMLGSLRLRNRGGDSTAAQLSPQPTADPGPPAQPLPTCGWQGPARPGSLRAQPTRGFRFPAPPLPLPSRALGSQSELSAPPPRPAGAASSLLSSSPRPRFPSLSPPPSPQPAGSSHSHLSSTRRNAWRPGARETAAPKGERTHPGAGCGRLRVLRGGYECVLTEAQREAAGGRTSLWAVVAVPGSVLSFRVCACRFMYPRVPSRGASQREGEVGEVLALAE